MSIFTTAIGPPSPPGNPDKGLKPVFTVSLGSGVACDAESDEDEPAQAVSRNAIEEKRAIFFRFFVIPLTIGANCLLPKPRPAYLWVMFQKTAG